MHACVSSFSHPITFTSSSFSLAWTTLLGKAGGGGVRRRIAVGAVNFTRGAHNWAKSHLDEHSYPVMRRDGTTVNAKFCNSARFHHQRNRTIQTYEGNLVCTAQTPLGKMLACPGNLSGISGPTGLCLPPQRGRVRALGIRGTQFAGQRGAVVAGAVSAGLVAGVW